MYLAPQMIRDVTALIRSHMTTTPTEVRIISFSLKSIAWARRNQHFSQDNTFPFCWVFKRESSTKIHSTPFFPLLATTNTTTTGRQKGQHGLTSGTASQRPAIASATHSSLITALEVVLQIFKWKQIALQASSNTLSRAAQLGNCPLQKCPKIGKGNEAAL